MSKIQNKVKKISVEENSHVGEFGPVFSSLKAEIIPIDSPSNVNIGSVKFNGNSLAKAATARRGYKAHNKYMATPSSYESATATALLAGTCDTHRI